MIFNTLDYADIPVGSHQSGLICPQCKGGDRHDRSFFVARNATSMHWFCYRAKCGFVGSTTDRHHGSKYDLLCGANAPRPVKDTRYSQHTYPLDKADLDYFRKRFDIDGLLPYGAIKYTNHDEYLFAIYDPNGKVRGHVLRQPVWKGAPQNHREQHRHLARPKALNYMVPGAIPMSWYGDNEATVVLVEDQVSAMRLAQQANVTAVALLGTRLSTTKAVELSNARPDARILIALDPDATAQAIDIAMNWRSYVNMKVVLYSADPKDVPMTELLEKLQ